MLAPYALLGVMLGIAAAQLVRVRTNWLTAVLTFGGALMVSVGIAFVLDTTGVTRRLTPDGCAGTPDMLATMAFGALVVAPLAALIALLLTPRRALGRGRR